VEFLYLPDPPTRLPGTSFVLYAPRKIFLQVFYILEALLDRIPQPPEFIVLQVRSIFIFAFVVGINNYSSLLWKARTRQVYQL
jgi:hypothetical protein